MIKVNRKGVDITVKYYNDFCRLEGSATTFCKDIKSAKELAKTIRQARDLGYGFAKCRAILEGDTL